MTYKSILVTSRPAKPQAVALCLYDKTKTLPGSYADVDRETGGVLSAALKRTGFSSPAGSITTLHTTKGPTLYVMGLGTQKDFQANHLRAAASKLMPMLFTAGVKSLHWMAGPLEEDAAESARDVGEGMGLGSFTFREYKGTANPNGKPKGPNELSVSADGKAAREAMGLGLDIAASANIARQLGATPPNVANPKYLADECRKMARETGLRCSIIDAKKARSLKMGGLLGVGQAGSTPPALICLEWRGGKKKDAPTLLVGKAVTFDTGGYSIKPMPGMLGMKYDKCGGMAVIGAMHAAATLKLPCNVVGLIPAAENMISDTAYRPSDILTLTNGVTVEVTNTDAEGRLILADALAWGCKTYKPAAVIDLATLTGAIVIALGPWCAGVFCGNEKLYRRVLAASETTGERIWRMPMWPEHRKFIQSLHGDISNSAGRDGGSCTAAAFLSYFVAKDGDFKKNERIPWAHIDIAGVSEVTTDRDHTGIYAKGPTGYGVRLLVEMLSQSAAD